MDNYRKSFEAGWEYAEFLGSDEPVGVEEMLGCISSMPEEDYATLRREGVDPDARAYWRGFNACVEDTKNDNA